MSGRSTLTILQLNDSHAYFDLHQETFWRGGSAVYRPAGGYARIATLARQIRADRGDRLLFCDCGDTLHGTYPALVTEGEALVPILNALGLDAMTGHWEFAYGPARFKQRAAQLNYPVLAANVYDLATEEHFFPPSMVKDIGGLRIGIVGLASNIVDKTMPASYSKGVRFTLGRDELPAIVTDLRTQDKVDLVVLISHLGFPQDMKLLSEVEGIDVCLSGHTHNRLHVPAIQGRTLVMQSGCHGSFLGRLDLDIDGGRVVGHRHSLIDVDASVAPDPDVSDLIEHALAPYRGELSTVVGDTATALNRVTMLETTMDNLLLQAMLERTGAQLAFSNGWRFGAPIVPGPVTLNDLYNIVPMNPPVSTVELTGEEVLAMLEENLERTFAQNPYEQLGGSVKRGLGFTAYIKIENPRGRRVQQVFVGDDVLQPGRRYPATFITEQGVASTYGDDRRQDAGKIIDALRTYLARHPGARADLRGTFVAA